MLRIDRATKSLTRLGVRNLPEVGLRERDDIQQMIRSNPDAFFEEMGEKLLLIAEEVRPSDVVEDRVDLLAIDPAGAATIIELKRRDHKLHLLQALAYASMISRWPPERFVAERSKLLTKPPQEAEDDIEQYLLEDFGTLNQTQRIILVAEGFDWEVLVTSEWLSEKYDLDIRCYRLSLAVDGSTEYLTCTCVFPPPELTAEAVKRRSVGIRPARWTDWEASLAEIDNQAVAEFFRTEIASGRENWVGRRALHFRVNGKRMYFVAARREKAYVWQHGRFHGDEKFWNDRLGVNSDVKPVKEGRRLRFFLQTPQQFETFRETVAEELPKVNFSQPGGESGAAEDDPTLNRE